MEQYEIARKEYFENIQLCLKYFKCERLFIRDCGSMDRWRGEQKVNEVLGNRKLEIKKAEGGLSILINNNEVFLCEQDKNWGRKFTIAYERKWPDGRYVMLSTGINPDDSNLPAPEKSIIRGATMNNLIEITFLGKIPLKFHSYMFPDRKSLEQFKYWIIDKSRIGSRIK